MKKRIILVLIVTIININLFAQNKKDSARIYKNEVGINLLTLLNNDKAIANIFYKRQLKPNWFGRASFILYNNKNNQNNNLIEIKGLPDSKLGFQYTQNEPKKYLQYNLGIERRFGKGIVKQFTGIDLGFAHYQTKQSEIYGIRDSIENNSTPNYSQNGLITKSDSIIFRQKTISNSIIFTPFYGLQFNISKHFMFSTQAGVALSLTNSSKKSLTDNRPIKTESYSYTNFDLDITQVSCNFSICYRF